jgi:hypothetical protein
MKERTTLPLVDDNNRCTLPHSPDAPRGAVLPFHAPEPSSARSEVTPPPAWLAAPIAPPRSNATARAAKVSAVCLAFVAIYTVTIWYVVAPSRRPSATAAPPSSSQIAALTASAEPEPVPTVQASAAAPSVAPSASARVLAPKLRPPSTPRAPSSSSPRAASSAQAAPMPVRPPLPFGGDAWGYD